MNKDLSILVEKLREQSITNRDWEYIFKSPLTIEYLSQSIHLGIFIEPYLSLIIEGKKTIESRFSINRCAPYRKVRKNDIILLKRSGGAIIGMCQVSQVWSYVLDKAYWEEIQNVHSKALCINNPDFWDQKKKSNYATLMKLSNIHLFETPIVFPKSDRRGWVVIHYSDNNQTKINF